MSRRLILGLLSLLMISIANAALEVVPGQALVRFAEPTTLEQAQKEFNANEFRVEQVLVRKLDIYLVKFDEKLDVETAVEMLKGNPKLLWAQADHILEQRNTPNDPLFGSQWDWNQASDADVDAPEAWDITTGGMDAGGNDIVVAVVDGGCRMTHSDLAANIWQNEAEINGVTGVDDDGNGYIDDKNGWDAYSNDGTIPSDNHGTHVSGTVGAVGNNGNLVTGVNWNVQIMEVAASSSTTSIISIGYGYVIDVKTDWLNSGGTEGANVVSTNSSFGIDLANCTTGSYPVWNDLYNAMGAVGVLSACATANANYNIDTQGDVPTSCSSPFIISVTNTTSTDQKNSGAAYGATTIDLGAPGTSILSTTSSNDNSTGTLTGTSMATPHVAGAVALMHAAASPGFYNYYLAYPDSAALVLKQMLLDGTDPIAALQGITVSGGRLNLYNACNMINQYVGVEPDEPFLTVESSSFTDATTGNDNGSWERGESVEILVSLNNLGEDALNVAATLSTADPYVTITNDFSTYGTILNGLSGDNSGNMFVAEIAPETPLDHVIDFSLAVTADSGYTRDLDFTLLASPKVPLYSEDFEEGSEFTHEVYSGSVDQWHLSTENAYLSTTSWKCGDTGTGNYANSQDASLISPEILLYEGSELRFWHTMDSEISGTFADSAYDGGNVWMSVNGGAYFMITPENGYSKHFRTTAGGGSPFTGAQPGAPCYAGTFDWTQATFDLSTYADSTVQFLFRFSTDAGTSREGWYVDDVVVYAAPNTVIVPQAIDGLVIQPDNSDVHLYWPASTTSGAVYRIYLSANPAVEPIDAFFIAQTTDTFYTDAGILDTNDNVFYEVTATAP